MRIKRNIKRNLEIFPQIINIISSVTSERNENSSTFLFSSNIQFPFTITQLFEYWKENHSFSIYHRYPWWQLANKWKSVKKMRLIGIKYCEKIFPISSINCIQSSAMGEFVGIHLNWIISEKRNWVWCLLDWENCWRKVVAIIIHRYSSWVDKIALEFYSLTML